MPAQLYRLSAQQFERMRLEFDVSPKSWVNRRMGATRRDQPINRTHDGFHPACKNTHSYCPHHNQVAPIRIDRPLSDLVKIQGRCSHRLSAGSVFHRRRSVRSNGLSSIQVYFLAPFAHLQAVEISRQRIQPADRHTAHQVCRQRSATCRRHASTRRTQGRRHHRYQNES